MSIEATEKLLLRDALGNAGELPIPRQRYRNLAVLRLLVVIPMAVVPTQLNLRHSLSGGWDIEFGRLLVDLHLASLGVYVLASLAMFWSARATGDESSGILQALNWLCIACEIVANQVFLVAFGNLDNYAIGFLVLIVVPYRVLFDFRTGVGTLVAAMALYLFCAGLEIGGVLPAAPLYPYMVDHPVRSNPQIWMKVLIYVPLVMALAFMSANYASNQSARLHRYVTRSVLQRYLPPALVDRAAKGELQLDAPPERRVVTVMFTDIVGFTSLSERLGPVVVGDLLNRLLGEIATLALEHGATVDKFIGDCVMVVFGAPDPSPTEEQVRRCVALGQAIHARVVSLGEEHQLQARTGLNTGEVVVGNFGSAARSDYTVLGPVVNVAARLESASRPNRILLGPESARLLQGSVSLEQAGLLHLKGVSAPVEGWFVAESGGGKKA